MDLIAEKRGTLEGQENLINDEHLELVNRFSVIPLKREDVYLRSMYLCNDIIDAYASRFTKDALEQICQLIIGESVLKGHQHSSLPIARFFKAALEEKDGHYWVRAWFYWLKNTEGAADLAKNIDGGVYREVSIAWRYQTATCSICKEDIRKCPHIPGDYYEGKLCYYEMGDIKEVLEGSLVFKGGQMGTYLAGERSKSKDDPEPRTVKKQQRKMESLTEENLQLRSLAEIGKHRLLEIKEEVLRLARAVAAVENGQRRLIRLQERLTAAADNYELLKEYWEDYKREFDRHFPPRRMSAVAELTTAATKEDAASYRMNC